MKYLSLIAILLVICFTSCDGRDRVYKSNTENLENSQLSQVFFEHLTYIPAQYTEVITDTILSSKLRVNIKYYTLLNADVTVENITTEQPKVKKHYRQFESEITVFKKDKLLFAYLLKTSDFYETNNPSFWNNAILQYVWLDDFESNEKQIQICCSFLSPKTKAYKSYAIYFNTVGERKIELIESS